MIQLKQILKGGNGKTWCLSEKNDVWLVDPKDTTGTYGDIVSFCLGDVEFKAQGPWLSTREAMMADTNENHEEHEEWRHA